MSVLPKGDGPMTYKPPHGTFDMLFASPKNHARMAKENRDYRDSYNRGRGFADGQRSRKKK